MKKILLVFTYFLACIVSTQAQSLYGTTFNGGSNFGGGTISKFIPATNILTVAHSFGNIASKPLYTNFIQASDGKLYGMTSQGGIGNYGVIFSFDPSSFTYTKLHDFDKINGAFPNGSLMQASDGKLYGMTNTGGSNDVGVIFSFDPSTSTYIKLKDFNNTDGTRPYGSLIEASDGKLYGMANQGGSGNLGTIFSFDPSLSIYTKLHDFDNTNGSYPSGDLLQAADGKLYGMASSGGISGYGVIFSFDPSTSNYTKLEDLDYTKGVYPSGNLIQASDGKLYGMTTGDLLRNARGLNPGSIFSFDPSASVYTKLKDFDFTNGATPLGSLFQASDGKLYGLTSDGGILSSEGRGVIFSFDPSAGTYTKLKDLNNTDGVSPFGSLIQASDGKLYGMTSEGGISNAGVTFSFDFSTSTYAKKDFGNTSGQNPECSLIHASDGKLYGTTLYGGNRGVIFSFDPSSSTYTKVKDLEDGGFPGSLMQASDGKHYGMTFSGGSNGFGVIFSFDPSSSTYTKLIDFDYATGANPRGSLVQASNGKFYGMTYEGGSSGFGVIFSFDPISSTYTKLKDFDNTNGANPFGSLIQANDGKLYGMTYQGGNFSAIGAGAGVIFSFDPSSSTYTKLKEFDDGANPFGSLMQAGDGKLYGMTYSGGAGAAGIIFSYDPSSSTYTRLKDFDTTNGAGPRGNLMQASDGKLYGATNQGGASGVGVIFSFDPSSSTYTKLKDYDGANGANPDIGSSFIEVKECIADTTFYKDADGDGYGNPADSVVACSRPAGYVTNNTDCNDSNAAIHPGATEVCNGIDDNCDGQVDEGLVFTTYYPDADGDGYGTGGGQSFCKDPGSGYATKGGDCNDANPAIHPGATEICGNGIDDNCNGQVDEDCTGKPAITINDVTVNESQGVAVLTVTLSHATTKPVWILYFTKDGTAVSRRRHKDYVAKFGLVFIRPGSLTGTISIKIIKDNITEPTEYFDVILLASLNADITDRSGRVFITDDMVITNSKTVMKGIEITSANSLEIKVMPNPGVSRFNITVESNNKTDKINMKVMDVQGKLIEARGNLMPGQVFRIGSNYRPGTYFIQAVQGKQRRTTTVIKLSE